MRVYGKKQSSLFATPCYNTIGLFITCMDKGEHYSGYNDLLYALGQINSNYFPEEKNAFLLYENYKEENVVHQIVFSKNLGNKKYELLSKILELKGAYKLGLQENEYGISPLSGVVALADSTSLQLLLDAGASAHHYRSADGQTLLMSVFSSYLSKDAERKIALQLLSHGARYDKYTTDNTGKTVAEIAQYYMRGERYSSIIEEYEQLLSTKRSKNISLFS